MPWCVWAPAACWEVFEHGQFAVSVLAGLSSLLWCLLLAVLVYVWSKQDKRLEKVEKSQSKSWDAIIRHDEAIRQLREDSVRDADCAEYRSKLAMDMIHDRGRIDALTVQMQSREAVRGCK